ncbi:MAG TPA: hypothetical protein VNM67_08365 [Thermoanaerobaculia bacterium]|jgi:hypothetical protein|nr:hypothetical protein [Thermoanaerobaculia bacterium]
MPVKESQFSLSQLWPPSNNHWMAPGAVQATAAQFGQGLDLGALRVSNGIWEILYSRTPTREKPASSEWIPFEPSVGAHLLAANGFRRYGPGWSYGPGHNQHSEVITYFSEVHGRMPTEMEQLDVEHNKSLYQSLLKEYQDKIGFTPGTGTGTGTPGPVTQPPAGLPPLSAPEQRAAELMSLLPQYLQRSWMTPLVVEAVKAGRRAQDRVVQRVIAGLKEGK